MLRDTPTDPADSGTVFGRWGAFALCGMAVVSIEATTRVFETRSELSLFCAVACGAVVAAAGVSECLHRRFPAWVSPLVTRRRDVAAAVGVAVIAEIGLQAWHHGAPLLDAVLLVFLRDTVIALALLSYQPERRPAAALMATFLMVTASASSDDARIQGVVVVFAGVGACWLMHAYWESLRGHTTSLIGPRRPPRVWLAAVPLAVAVVPLALPAIGLTTRALDGFMPASGGRRWSSAAARGGVGDGDMLVRGLDDIRSFGPIEDAPFMNAEEASLYDMFDDMYNEPVKRQQQRAISLPPSVFRRPEDPTLATSNRAGREFSTVRRSGRPSSRRIDDLSSRALFHVKGRVPLHLRLETFAVYDGVDWLPEEVAERAPDLSITMVGGRPWLRPELAAQHDVYALPETHAIKVAALRSDRIPSPNQLLGVHIDKVEHADFYRWARPDVLRIDGESIPEHVVVHLQSRVVDVRLLARCGACFVCGHESYRQFGDDPQSCRVRALAESWVSGVPRGLRQIERVVECLKNGYELDSAARATGEEGHSVAEFLFETHRGPDYLFASAAVCTLRSLGYSARLVSGFHVNPARYDRRSGHTPVLADDVHVWAEVAIGGGQWLSLEPSPGYALLAPPASVVERLLTAALATARLVVRHPLPTAFVAVVAALLWWRRVVIADGVDALLVHVRHRRDDRDAMRATLALLDRRCRRAGVPRPPHTTPPYWLAELAERMSADSKSPWGRGEDCRIFMRLADAALYAPIFRSAYAAEQRRMAHGVWSLHNLTALSPGHRGRSSAAKEGGTR